MVNKQFWILLEKEIQKIELNLITKVHFVLENSSFSSIKRKQNNFLQ